MYIPCYFTVEIQNENDVITVGMPYDISCIFYTSEVVNPDNLNISWIGPDGTITNNSSRISVIPTTSDDHNHTSVLRFSYISEEDKSSSYTCTASISGEPSLLSDPFNLTNLTSKLISCYSYTYVRVEYFTLSNAYHIHT